MAVKPTELSHVELLDAVNQHLDGALEEGVRRWHSLIERRFDTNAPDLPPDEVNDLVLTTITRMAATRSRDNNPARTIGNAYVCTVADHALSDYMEKRNSDALRHAVPLPGACGSESDDEAPTCEPHDDRVDVEKQVLLHLEMERIWRAVDGLPNGKQRTAVRMRLGGEPFAAVAVVLNTSIAAAKQHYQAGIERVRRALGLSPEERNAAKRCARKGSAAA